MASSPRVRRALKILAVLLVLPVLGAGGTSFWIRGVADRKWENARRRIQELKQADPDVLPPLPATDLSKELQIHFVAAIRESVQRNSREYETRDLVRLRQRGEAVDAVLNDAQDFLDRLHEGGRGCAATPAEFPPGWRGEWDKGTLLFVMNCGVLRARRIRERNDPVAAAETILDVLQLARFWASSGMGDNEIEKMDAFDESYEELRDILAREPLSRDQLQRIERELEPLEAAMQSPTFYLESRLARWGVELEARDLKESGLLNYAPYRWRYLLPNHLMKAEAFEFYDRHLRRLLADEKKSFLEMTRDRDELARQEDDSKNPLISETSNPLRWVDWSGFVRMAQSRLLRCAARYRATGEILKLKDPFGLEILHSRNGNRMKFWSLGWDGQDDGGDAGSEGRWTQPNVVPGAPRPRWAKDLVIEVELPRPR